MYAPFIHQSYLVHNIYIVTYVHIVKQLKAIKAQKHYNTLRLWFLLDSNTFGYIYFNVLYIPWAYVHLSDMNLLG